MYVFGRQEKTERERGSCNGTFYGVEVGTRDISDNPLFLMGGAHVNLQGGRDKHDMMLDQSPLNKCVCACKACQVTTATIRSYMARCNFIDPSGQTESLQQKCICSN